MASYSSELSDYIDGWLNTFITAKSLTQVHDAPRLNWNDMPTPPSSELSASVATPDRRRSPKRPRHNDSSETEAIHDSPFDEQTPTGPQRRLQMHLPSRPFANAPNLPPSSSTSGTSNNTSRSSSPVKRSTLELLKKPVRFIPIKKSRLPKDIHKTYDKIFSIAHGNAFIPRAVRTALEDQDEDVLSQWFFTHDDGMNAEYQTELTDLGEIQEAAVSRQIEGASEAAWNLDVHGPLLKLALKPFSSLRREIITHANISKPFVPEMQTGSYYDMTKSKMIDFGITVSPSASTASHISQTVNSLPLAKGSINQTIYGPVKNKPIALSIEVKIASGSLEEARGQLGLWIAAWHTRMSLLRKCNEEIIALPLVIVMEHEWKLMFAVDRGDSIDIVEHINMGDTMDLAGLYRIVAVLRELGRWMETEYLAWLDRWLGLAPPLGTTST